MMVVEARVVKSCLRRQGNGMGPSPSIRHVLTKGLAAGVQHGEPAGSALASDLGVEVARITFTAEGPGAVVSVLAPAHPPDDLPARARDLLDAHRVLLLAAGTLPDRSHSTDRRDGPANFGTVTARGRGTVRSGSRALAHSSTACAEMTQRDPRLTAGSSTTGDRTPDGLGRDL
jgi:hypothetical protein